MVKSIIRTFVSKEFIKFGIIGVANTAINLGIYYFLIYLNINYLVANTIGFIVSVLNAYYLNNKYTFKKQTEGNAIPLLKTFISYGTTFLLTTGLLYIFVDMLNLSDNIAPLICLPIIIPLNFLLNKFWAFK